MANVTLGISQISLWWNRQSSAYLLYRSLELGSRHRYTTSFSVFKDMIITLYLGKLVFFFIFVSVCKPSDIYGMVYPSYLQSVDEYYRGT